MARDYYKLLQIAAKATDGYVREPLEKSATETNTYKIDNEQDLYGTTPASINTSMNIPKSLAALALMSFGAGGLYYLAEKYRKDQEKKERLEYLNSENMMDDELGRRTTTIDMSQVADKNASWDKQAAKLNFTNPWQMPSLGSQGVDENTPVIFRNEDFQGGWAQAGKALDRCGAVKWPVALAAGSVLLPFSFAAGALLARGTNEVSKSISGSDPSNVNSRLKRRVSKEYAEHRKLLAELRNVTNDDEEEGLNKEAGALDSLARAGTWIGKGLRYINPITISRHGNSVHWNYRHGNTARVNIIQNAHIVRINTRQAQRLMDESWYKNLLPSDQALIQRGIIPTGLHPSVKAKAKDLIKCNQMLDTANKTIVSDFSTLTRYRPTHGDTLRDLTELCSASRKGRTLGQIRRSKLATDSLNTINSGSATALYEDILNLFSNGSGTQDEVQAAILQFVENPTWRNFKNVAQYLNPEAHSDVLNRLTGVYHKVSPIQHYMQRQGVGFLSYPIRHPLRTTGGVFGAQAMYRSIFPSAGFGNWSAQDYWPVQIVQYLRNTFAEPAQNAVNEIQAIRQDAKDFREDTERAAQGLNSLGVKVPLGTNSEIVKWGLGLTALAALPFVATGALRAVKGLTAGVDEGYRSATEAPAVQAMQAWKSTLGTREMGIDTPQALLISEEKNKKKKKKKKKQQDVSDEEAIPEA